ncbi:DUF4336 domain-containing protein [Synechococcus sp. CS-1328]|uniref:DUF4336 domain-containing protein n=1 Tax=Synechococcus sp. CS-1328 TaxID=2847976 RepID=UPI00223B8E13|nr:DUF4336 domain-containing protein [Synechococcus sp. CS-1328]
MTVAEAVADQRWPWWPLLPLYPYGQRRTLVRELIADQVWSFEQLQGIYYVAVPIRMTVLRLEQGLLLYAPVAPTPDVLRHLAALEQIHGPVRTIVLPTSSGLEHKLPVPAMARAFPNAQIWVSSSQWSFPLNLPLSWLGFPARRTHILGNEGYPHPGELEWCSLGPLNLGLGTFQEVACLHRASGSVLITDALVSIGAQPPQLFDADPTPLLFHARERAEDPLVDSPAQRQRGWKRLVLFASYLRPASVSVPPLGEVLRHSLSPGLRQRRAHFGFYPFRWQPGWEQDFETLQGGQSLQVAPVLERLVFPRCRQALVDWLNQLARWSEMGWLIPAHYDAPVACRSSDLERLASQLQQRNWAPDTGGWEVLASIDQQLLRLGLVPEDP